MGFNNNNDDDDDFFIRVAPENDSSGLVTDLNSDPDESAQGPGESMVQRDPYGNFRDRLNEDPYGVGSATPDQGARTAEDPCVDPPARPGGDTTAMEFDDPSEVFIFPQVDATERAEQIARLDDPFLRRQNLFIPQQYYYDEERRIPQNALFVPRAPNYAYSSGANMNSRAPQILIDPFRYTSGLVYEHLDSELINLPTGETASVISGSPRYIGELGSLNYGPGGVRIKSRVAESVSTGIFYSLRLRTSDQGHGAYRGEGLESRTLISDLEILFNPQNLILEEYEAMTGPLREIYENIQSGDVPAAAQIFINNYLIGRVGDDTAINTDRSSRGEGGATGIPFEDHTFTAPAAFYEGEATAAAAQPIAISSVKSFYYENEEALLNQGFDPSEADRSFQEYSIPSLYRRYAIDYGIRSSDSRGNRIDLNVEKLICPENDIVQKFPAEQVNQIAEINRLFFSDDVLNTPSENIWLQRNLGPYNKVQFNMPDSPIAEMLAQSRVDTIILEMIESKADYNPTYYTQILDQTIDYAPILNLEDLDLQGQEFAELFRDTVLFQDQVSEGRLGDVLNDRVSINLRPNEYHKPFYDLERFMYQDLDSPRNLYDFVVDEDEYPLSFYGSEKMEEDPTGLALHRKLGRLYERNNLENTLDQFILDRERSYHEIFKAEPSYSEVIAFRVEKIETATNEVLQNFYFFNSGGVQSFSFVDKQVITGRKYTYKIYCLNLVVGCTYEYVPRIIDTNFENLSRLQYGIRVKSARSVKIVETPYFEQQIITALKKDLPPLPPTAQPYRGGNASDSQENNYIFEMSSNVGTLLEKPVIIKEEDVEIITDTLSNQRATGTVSPNSQKIKYKSDSIPSHYEMMMLSRPPTSYSDFSRIESVIVESSSPLIEFAVPPNKPRYVIFRAHDEAGISNPTAVYKFENIDAGTGSFLSFERYEMFDVLDDLISFERNISIEPAFDQSMIDFRRLIDTLGEDLYNSAPRSETQGPMNLGITEPSIWGEEFIFRITSVYSGRSFDVSVVFDQEDRGEAEPPQREQEEYSSELCENEALEKARERRDNRREADDYLDRLNRTVVRRSPDQPQAPDPEGADIDPVEELDIPNEEEILGPEGPDFPEGPDGPEPPGPPGGQPEPPPPLPPDPRRSGGGGNSGNY